jgi:hypothetical protein
MLHVMLYNEVLTVICAGQCYMSQYCLRVKRLSQDLAITFKTGPNVEEGGLFEYLHAAVV